MSKSYKHLRKVTKLRLRQSCGLCRRLEKRIEKCLENDVKCDNKMVVLLYRSINYILGSTCEFLKYYFNDISDFRLK